MKRCIFFVVFFLSFTLLATSSPIINITTDNDSYHVSDSAIFDIHINYNNENPDYYQVEATFPNPETSVFVTKINLEHFKYQTSELTLEGEQTFTFALYKKTAINEIRLLEIQKNVILSEIAFLSNLKICFPQYTTYINLLLEKLYRILSYIESRITTLKIPSVFASKSITVLNSNDNEPPVFEVIEDITVEAYGIETNVILPEAIVTDNLDNNPTITNNAPALFPIGVTTVTYTARDASGNEASISFNVTVEDTIAPITSHNFTHNNEWINTTQTIQFSAIDSASGVSNTFYKINDGETETINPLVFDTDGIYTIKYWSIDLSGNEEAIKTLTVKLDKTIPLISASFIPEQNENGWYTNDVQVTFIANDNLSGIQNVTMPLTITTEGKNQIVTGTALDYAGNINSIQLSLNIDKTPPLLETNLLENISTEQESYIINGTVTDANEVIVSINGENISTTNNSFSKEIMLNFGENAVEIKGIDEAGLSSTKSIIITRTEIITPPTIDINYPINGTVEDKKFFIIEYSWNAGTYLIDTNTLHVLLNGTDISEKFTINGNIAHYETSQYDNLINGSYTLNASIKDIQGNIAEKTSNFTINANEILPPPIEEETSSYMTGQVLNGRTNEPIYGAKVTINGDETKAVYTNSKGYYTYPISTTGLHALLIEHTDFSYNIKKVEVEYNQLDYTIDTAYLVPVDSAKTVITSSGGIHTHSEGLIEIDFPEGALNEGQTIQAQSIWYEKEEELPGKMPPYIGFTYCVELLPDGTQFQTPVTVKIKNTRGFSPGTEIPVGYYDRTKALWEHATNSVVDPTGEWIEFQVNHFSPYDANIPVGIFGNNGDLLTPPEIAPKKENIVLGFKLPPTPNASNINFSTGSFDLNHTLSLLNNQSAYLNYASNTVNHNNIFQVKADNSITDSTSPITAIKNTLFFQGLKKINYYKPSSDLHISRMYSEIKNFRDGKSEALKTGVYSYKLEHSTLVKAEFYISSYFGGPPISPTGVYTTQKVNQTLFGQVSVINNIDSNYGSGWSFSEIEKLSFNAGRVLIDKGSQGIIFEPIKSDDDVYNFSYIIDKYSNNVSLTYYDKSGVKVSAEILTLFPNGNQSEIAIVDFNNDGLEDIIAVDNSSNVIKFFANKMPYRTNYSDPCFEEEELNLQGEAIPSNACLAYPYATDLDDDKKIDIVFTDLETGTGYILKNINTLLPYKIEPTSWSVSGEIKINPNGFRYVIGEGDFNADGKKDLLSKPSPYESFVYIPLYNNDNYSFFSNGTFTVSGGNIKTVYVNDINSDGRSDIIGNSKNIQDVYGYGGGNDENKHLVETCWTTLEGHVAGLNSISQGVILEDITKSGSSAVGDFNNDNIVDIVTLSYDPNIAETQIKFFKGNGLGAFKEDTTKTTVIYNYNELTLQNIKVQDINNDNNLDILWINSEQFGILYGNGTGSFSEGPVNYDYKYDPYAVGMSSFKLNQTLPSKYIGSYGENSILTINFTTEFPYTRTLKSGERHFYTANGLIAAKEDKGGNRTTFTYIDADGDGKEEEISEIVYPDERKILFTYLYGKVYEIKDLNDRVTELSYNSNGDLIKIKNPDGTIKEFDYDNKHLMTKMTDENGNVTRYEYSPEGMLLKEIKPIRTNVEINNTGYLVTPQTKEKIINYAPEKSKGVPLADYEGTKNNPYPNVLEEDLKFEINIDGYTESITGKVNEFDSIIQVNDELGKTTSFDRDDKNNITKITKPNLAEYAMSYDTLGNLLEKKDLSLDASYKYEYEEKYNQVKKITNTLDKIYEISYLNEGSNTMLPLITEIKDPLNQYLKYEYDNFGVFKNLLSKKIDRKGNEITYEYDNHGNVSKIKANVTRIDENNLSHAEIIEINMEYDNIGNLVKMTDPRNNEFSYEYDLMNRLIKTTYPDLTESKIQYDNAGNILKTIDRELKETSYEYDAANRLIKITDALNNDTKYFYNGKDQVSYIEDAKGNTTKFYYNEKGQLIKTWNGKNNLTEYEYTENGNIFKITKPSNSVYKFEYDDSDRLIKLTYPNGEGGTPYVEIKYDKEGNREEVRRNLRTTKYEYDDLNRIKEVTLTDNTTLKYTYDENSNIKEQTTRNNTIYKYAFDELNRLLNVTDPLNIVTARYQYDLASNVIANTNALNRTTRFEWDQNERITKIIDALNNVTEFEYSAVGNLLRTKDRNGIFTENQFDDLHRLILTKENATNVSFSGLTGESRITQFEYDSVSNRTKIIDGNGFETKFEFDELNRLSKQILPDGKEYSFEYDELGRLQTKTTPLGNITYTYDDRGNLLTKVLPGDTYTYTHNIYNELLTSSNSNAEWSYDHDDVGRITNATLNISGINYNLIYTYTLARLQSFTSPAGTVSYTYDDSERISNIATSDGDNFGYTYSDLGEVLNKTRPNNVNETNTFDELGRLISISNTMSGNNLLSLVYSYDFEGNKLSETLSFTDSLLNTKSEGKHFKYDPLYRLRGIKKVDPSIYLGTPTFDTAPTFNEMTTLDLDILGNRISMSSSDLLNGTSSLIEYNKTDGTYYADPTNKINKVSSSGLSGGSSSSLTHDLNGNIIDDGRNVYTFDVENKLIEVKDKASGSVIANYYYDAEGRRIKSLHGSSGQSSLYIYSGDQIVEERDSSGALLQHNVFGLGIDDLLVTNKGGIKYYPLTNDQSSVLALTDNSGNVLQRYDYDSFGNVTVLDSEGDILSGVEGTPLITTLFQGRELDLETGLYYFRARYYSPELGRFISHDPMDYVDGMNMYEFVMGNPTTFVDPFGLMSDSADIGPGSVGFGIENEGALVDREIANQVISHAKANADTMEIPDIPGDGGIESIPEQGPKEGDNIETNPIIEKTPEDTKFTTPITPQNPDDGKCITYKPPEDPTGGKLTTPILEKQPGDNIEKNESGEAVKKQVTCEIPKPEKKPVVIGENMNERVIPTAKKIGADYYKPTSKNPENWKRNNKKWIQKQINENRKIYNAGIDPKRPKRSEYFKMEQDEIKEKEYPTTLIDPEAL